MLFVEYPKCSTCQKAKRYLEERGAAFEDRPIHTQPPTVEESLTRPGTSSWKTPRRRSCGSGSTGAACP